MGRKINIYGTIGPSCDDEGVLVRLIREGMTGIRVNLSHISLADAEETIGRIRSAFQREQKEPEILMDMQGPEMRIGALREPIPLKEGACVQFVSDDRRARASSAASDVYCMCEGDPAEGADFGIDASTGKSGFGGSILAGGIVVDSGENARSGKSGFDGGISAGGAAVDSGADARSGKLGFDGSIFAGGAGALSVEGEEIDKPVIDRGILAGEFGADSGRIEECGEVGNGSESMSGSFPEECMIPIDNKIMRKLVPGQLVKLDDGKLLLEMLSDGPEQIKTARVLRGGLLPSRKSIAVEGQESDLMALTEKDLENISLAKRFGITGLMQPFVRGAEDLMEVRKALREHGAEGLRIYAKIENKRGVERLSEIIPEADEIIIARGDLGNAMPLWELPACQKRIAKACRQAGKPFMVVTQMLASMERNPVPTRAEVSDIYNAVLDGAASVMVTGETAVGKYPAEVIRYLSRTCREAAGNCQK